MHGLQSIFSFLHLLKRQGYNCRRIWRCAPMKEKIIGIHKEQSRQERRYPGVWDENAAQIIPK
jgi:hypothetical protein